MSSVSNSDSPGNSNPLISIIVPVRDMANTVARTLDSVVNQNYSSVEVIVVDGQSEDDTLERIKPYRNKIAALISESDFGLYDAVNKGIKRATGDIVAILNGDDYYSHDGVVSAYAKKFEDQEVGIVFGDLEFFTAQNPSRTIRSYSSARFTPEKLSGGWMPPHPTVFVRKSIYDEIGDYQTDYQISSDFEFLIRALWRNSIKYDRIDSVVVRMQYGGLSTKGIKATYILNKEIIRACRANGLDTSWWRILLKFPAKLAEFTPALKSLASTNRRLVNGAAAPGSTSSLR